MKRELLCMDHVSLIKNGETWLDNLNFQMFSGEIMGLVSSSNKGHDQLIDLICYNHPISFGSVWYNGRTVNRYSFSDGSRNRVAVIEQQSHLVEGLSVADNVFVLREGFKKYLIQERVLREQTERFFAENGLFVDLHKRVLALTVLERCLVELGKALLMGCRLLIVDNPGNFLSQVELNAFQHRLREVKKQGISVLYIGNHHQEVFRIADRTSLFSNGRIIKVFERDEMTDAKIAPYITEWFVPKAENEPETAEGALHFHHICTKNLDHLRFVLHRGECLTLLDLNNRIAQDILDLLTGSLQGESGWISLEHQRYLPKNINDCLDAGIAIIPKDPVENLLFWHRSYMENLTFFVDRKLKKSVLSEKIYRSIRREFAPVIGTALDEVSVENLPFIEKLALVYYRIQLLKPRVLVCVQPLARGDMFVRMKILTLLGQILKMGTAVLIITANISDTLEISDRLLVIENGHCAASYEKWEFDQLKG